MSHQWQDVLAYLWQHHPSIYQEILKDSTVKRELICQENCPIIFPTMEGLEHLLDEEGLSLLATSTVSNKIFYVRLALSYVSYPFLENDLFWNIVLPVFSQVKNLFSSLSYEAAHYFYHFLKRSSVSEEKISSLLLGLSYEVALKLVSQENLPMDDIWTFIRNGHPVCEYLLQEDLRITSLKPLSFQEFYQLVKQGITIPQSLLEEQTFCRQIVEMEDVYAYRLLMRKLECNHDISFLEQQRTRYYDLELSSYCEEEEMLKRFASCYHKIEEALNTHSKEKIENLLTTSTSSFGEISLKYKSQIKRQFLLGNLEGIKAILQTQSREMMMRILIDYHFSEIAYNFFLNLRQLCHFASIKPILTLEELTFYDNIFHLENLSYREKMKWHQKMKYYPCQEQFYHHFLKARELVASLLNQSMIHSSNLSNYRNNLLSKQWGVDIYELDNEPFYALVKCLQNGKDRPLTEEDFYPTDGASYTYTGSDCLDLFKDPSENYTLLYDYIPKKQLVHVYPDDSYSLYQQGGNVDVSSHVHFLVTPVELVNLSNQYNELVLAQYNSLRDDEVNQQLTIPKRIALYCYDEVTDMDILSAKNLGIGIVVVKTKNYRQKGKTTYPIYQKLQKLDQAKYHAYDAYYQNQCYIQEVGDQGTHLQI